MVKKEDKESNKMKKERGFKKGKKKKGKYLSRIKEGITRTCHDKKQ